MRVLFWSETYWPQVGGVETLAVRLVAALRARGYELQVVTWADAARYEVTPHDEILIHRFPFFKRSGQHGVEPVLEQLSQVARLKREYAPDLVHVNSYGRSTWFHVSTAGSWRTPTLLSLHQQLPEAAFDQQTLAAKVTRSADSITCCSRAVYEATARAAPALAARLSVIENAVPVPALEPNPLPHEPPTLLFVGRLVREKGLDWALGALRSVLQGHYAARLIVVGEGPLRLELEKRADGLGLRESVQFVGQVPPEAVADAIQQATIVIVPSLCEGFGLVALEAALMARPVVATSVGGLPEVVVHAETGLLVAPRDAAALAAAVRFLLEQPAEARRMGQAARQRAMTSFGWDRYVDAFDALYRQLGAEVQDARSRRLQRLPA